MKLLLNDPRYRSGLGDIDRVFDEFLGTFGRSLGLVDTPAPTPNGGNPRRFRKPAVDLYEEAENFHARFALPGVKKKEVTISLEDGYLTVKGEHRSDPANEEATVSFSRTVAVPEGVDADAVTAKLEDGILTVTLPKAEERKPKTIAIK